MRFRLWDFPQRHPAGEYYVNRVVNDPTTFFDNPEEAVEEAVRLGKYLNRTNRRNYTVRTVRCQDGKELDVIAAWTAENGTIYITPFNGVSYLTSLGVNQMAKFTLGTIPADLDKFWLVLAPSSSTPSTVPCYDVEQEARDEAAKHFSSNQGQKKIYLMEVVAVIDPVVPKVTWREELKEKKAE